MRKLLLTAAMAATLFTATDAGADSFQHTVSMSATAPLVCSFGGAPTNIGSFSSVSETSSSLAVAVGADAIGDQSASLTFANVFCNGNNTTVRLQRSGLKVNATVPIGAGFKTEIDYAVSTTWGGVPIVSLNTLLDDNTATIGAMNGNFVLNIHVPAGSGPFVAAEYQDALILTVQPTT